MPPGSKRAFGSHSDQQKLATWVFGGIAFMVIVGMVIFGPRELPPARHQAFGILCAVLCGLFGYFFTGRIRLVSEPNLGGYAKTGVRAGGGIALFVPGAFVVELVK